MINFSKLFANFSKLLQTFQKTYKLFKTFYQISDKQQAFIACQYVNPTRVGEGRKPQRRRDKTLGGKGENLREMGENLREMGEKPQRRRALEAKGECTQATPTSAPSYTQSYKHARPCPPPLTVSCIHMQVRTHCTTIYVRALTLGWQRGRGALGRGMPPQRNTHTYASMHCTREYVHTLTHG